MKKLSFLFSLLLLFATLSPIGVSAQEQVPPADGISPNPTPICVDCSTPADIECARIIRGERDVHVYYGIAKRC
jgi:hypothetical protein